MKKSYIIKKIYLTIMYLCEYNLFINLLIN